MSTTRFCAEPDEEDKVRHAQGRPIHEKSVIMLGWNWGKWMAGGYKIFGSSTSSVYVSQVWWGKRKWVPDGCGVNQTTGMNPDMLRADPSMKWGLLF